MRAAELWWNGKEDAFSSKLDKMLPACYHMDDIWMSSITKAPNFKEGVGLKASVLEQKEVNECLTYMSLWKLSMESSIVAVEATERAQESIEFLRKTVNEFRNVIKNDLVSMKAASERVQNEVMQMHDKYKQAQSLLTTPDFLKAIENAERMAVALKAIQDLTETKVSVAVFNGGK